MIDSLQQLLSLLKPYLRWVILGGVLFFLATTLRDHWQEVLEIRISPGGWASLSVALGATLLAHIFAGWVWVWTLQVLKQPVAPVGMIQVYLKTTIAKYLPGNVWHYYGRTGAATQAGAPLEVAMLSVLLEPLLMLAAALVVAALSSAQLVAGQATMWGMQCLGLLAVLVGIHPKVLNPAIQVVAMLKTKAKGKAGDRQTSQVIDRYPLHLLGGELIFLLFRGTGFVAILAGITSISWGQLPLVFSTFSIAWMLGMVVPGAPGGVGVFETTAIALLGNGFPAGITIAVVALYRFISILAEALAAGLVWLDERRCDFG